MIPVTIEERWQVDVHDERGSRKEMRSRYVVADPGKNPFRTKLSELITARRLSGRDGLTRPRMAACVAYADEFSKLPHPTLDHMRSFSAQLRTNGLTSEEADSVSGLSEFLSRYTS